MSDSSSGSALSKWRQLLVSWDTQQELYRPDRELGLRAMCELVARARTRGTPRVLDLACGTGRVGSELLRRGYDVIGADLSEKMVRHCRERVPPLPAAEKFESQNCAKLPHHKLIFPLSG